MDGDTNKGREQFPDGSIEKIVFLDFLTYERAIVTAGRNLNLIVGVNGSGKSSVICGICLAVGGNPKNLGRSESIGDFVRHGKAKGSVELYLADSKKGTQTVKIVIIRETNKCDYFINDKHATQKAVKEFATSYNIQIDNPCTFLAQDKVKSFSEQSPIELLRNTEKVGFLLYNIVEFSAGNPDLLKQHENLIKKREENKFLTKQKDEIENRMVNVKSEMDTLKSRVDNYHQMQLQNSKINALIKKQKVMEFTEEYDIYQEQHNSFKKLEKKCTRKAAACARLKVKQQKQAEVAEKYQKIAYKARSDMNNIKANLSNMAQEDAYKRMLADHENILKTARREHAEHEENLKTAQDKKIGFENALKTAREKVARFMAESLEWNSDKLMLEERLDELENKISNETTQCRQARQNLQNLEYDEYNRSPYDDRKSILTGERQTGNSFNGGQYSVAAEAWTYVEKNCPDMDVKVPFFEIKVRKEHAKIIEGLVGPRDLTMFIFTNKQDEEELARKFPKICTTVLTQNKVNNLEISARLPSRLSKLGFSKFAIELVQGPDVVLQYLCTVSGLYRIPVGGEIRGDYDKTVDSLCQDKFSRFVCGNQITDVKFSKYSHEKICTNRQLRDPRMLLCHENFVDKESGYKVQKAKLQNEVEEYEKHIEKLKKLRAETKTNLDDIRSKQSNLKAAQNAEYSTKELLDRAVQDLNRIKRNKPDLKAAAAQYEEKRKMTAEKVLAMANDMIKQMESLVTLKIDKSIYDAVGAPIHDERQKIAEKVLNFDKQLQTLRDEKMRKEVDVNALREKIRDLSEDLQETCGITTTNEAKMSPTEKAEWRKLEERFISHDLGDKSKDDIDKMLAEEQATRKMRVADGSSADVEKYKKLRTEREELEKNLADQTNNLAGNLQTLQQEIDAWRTPIESLIKAINRNYQLFFEEIKCIGEVHLDIPENPLDIANYGIMIMVSFRATEKVRRLDHQIQSGGERSVSTMLYLLALQELCPVPFRCVDEINQGMDPTNERKVFDIMVKKLTGCGNLAKTQYFLLTPKLLHGLTYNEKVTVLCVHNSRALAPKAYEYDAYTFLQRARALPMISA